MFGSEAAGLSNKEICYANCTMQIPSNPDFKSWRDLNKYKDQFSTIETGDKGRLIGCPVPGWNCYDQKRLDMLGIDFIADELGTETASWAEAQAAFARKEPFLLYSWEPHWIHAAMDLVGVKLPVIVNPPQTV